MGPEVRSQEARAKSQSRRAGVEGFWTRQVEYAGKASRKEGEKRSRQPERGSAEIVFMPADWGGSPRDRQGSRPRRGSGRSSLLGVGGRSGNRSGGRSERASPDSSGDRPESFTPRSSGGKPESSSPDCPGVSLRGGSPKSPRNSPGSCSGSRQDGHPPHDPWTGNT